MATTYTAIANFNLANSTTTQITFSAIPQIYADLELRYQVRDTTDSPTSEIFLDFNGQGLSGTQYSSTMLLGPGSASVTSSRYSSNGYPRFVINNPGTYTADVFGNGSVYIANYTTTTTKVIAIDAVVENNANAANYIVNSASQSRLAAAITSIRIQAPNFFVTGSSFTLYGIARS